MNATDERNALLRAILSEPGEDTPRLMFADWCDEHDEEPELAKQIRHEIAEQQCSITFENLSATATQILAITVPRPLRVFRRLAHAVVKPGETFLVQGVPLDIGHIAYTVGPAGEMAWRAWEYRRGFVHSVTCTAEYWLRHADAIYWHPEQTVECSRCIWVERNYPADLHARVFKECRTCNGTGRIPRPLVPGAHPIERVTLTALDSPYPPRLGGFAFALKCDDLTTDDPREYTHPLWPGIIFTLP